ncbi:MAG: fused MFS/spermidine synthase, partial [Planctomycetota bacterium]
MAVLLPGTLCIGATFPFAMRLLADETQDAAPAAARVYAWNTVGAILGSILAAFLLVPLLGFTGTAQLAISLNLLVAFLASLLFQGAKLRPRVAGACFLTAALVLFLPAPVSLLRMSPLSPPPKESPLIYSGVGRSATVALFEQSQFFDLRTNGLPEAAIARRGAPPVLSQGGWWLTALPVLARPDTRSMLVVGFGGGVALEGVPPTVASIDIVELEPKVIEANRRIAQERLKDPLADLRVRIIINDARSALALTSKRYDAIVSQPSHPWTAGASHLYTREFMELVQEHLQPGGVFLQWVNADFVDAELLKTLSATLLSLFDHVRLYRPVSTTLLFLASDQPLQVEAQLALTGRPLKGAHSHYAQLGIQGVDDVALALALEHAGVVKLADGAPITTDNNNRLAMQSPRSLGQPLSLDVDRLLSAWDPLVHADSPLMQGKEISLNRAYIAHRLAILGLASRAMRVVKGTRDPSTRHLAHALVLKNRGQAQEAKLEIVRALNSNGKNFEALFALIQPALGAIATGNPDPEIAQAVARLPDPAAAVVEAYQHSVSGNWAKVQELESRLAAARPTQLCYPLAARLRANWRCAVSSPERKQRGLEALQII